MSTRRSFFKKSFGIAGAASLTSLATQAKAEVISEALFELNQLTPEVATMDEDLWAHGISLHRFSKYL